MPRSVSTTALVEHYRQSGAMPTPPRHTPRESTEAMVRNIGQELAEIQQALGRCRGETVAEPRLTGTWMAHLLICSKELLQNLLIDTATRPKPFE